MIKFDFTINDELGIHARPAGALAKLAKSLDSKVTVFKGDKFADASKLLAVMGLNVKQKRQGYRNYRGRQRSRNGKSGTGIL